MLLCVHSSKSGQVYFLCEITDYCAQPLLPHSNCFYFFVSPVLKKLLWTVFSFLITDDHHCFFHVCTVPVFFSAADKTKYQLLQMLLPFGMTLSSGCLFTALDVWAKTWQFWKMTSFFFWIKLLYQYQIEKQNCLIHYFVDQWNFHSILVLVVLDKNIWLLFFDSQILFFSCLFHLSGVCWEGNSDILSLFRRIPNMSCFQFCENNFHFACFSLKAHLLYVWKYY